MTALKVKGLQIKKVDPGENFEINDDVTNMTKVVGGDSAQGWKSLFGLIAQFVTVGGDFV